jgi:hypothetical protein
MSSPDRAVLAQLGRNWWLCARGVASLRLRDTSDKSMSHMWQCGTNEDIK